MPFFAKSKTPKELMQTIHDNVVPLSPNSKDRRKVGEITKALTALRELLTDKSDTRLTGRERDAEFSQCERARINDILLDITNELINLNLLPALIANLDVIEFEMLRDACRHECLARIVLYSPEFYQLFEYVQGTAFDISSDAFSTLRDLLRRHKPLVAKFLEENYEEFFSHYQLMLQSENYVTKRQALKLLGELLLDRQNYTIMTKYISDANNLKTIMNLLRSPQKQISFEAFHCYKVFVANPKKPEQVHTILWRNKDKLIEFLSAFQNERSDDAPFRDEKEYVIKQIRDLKEPAHPTHHSTQ